MGDKNMENREQEMGNKEQGIGPGESSYKKWWTIAIALLIVIIIAGGAILLYRHFSQDESVEIVFSAGAISGSQEIYLGGAVNYPGIYSFSESDSIGDILQGAGGRAADADPGKVEITIPYSSEVPQPQKININTAETWLLDALPGIGSTLAQRIVDYRTEEGLFQSIEELTEVEGIGPVTLNNVKDKITVVD